MELKRMDRDELTDLYEREMVYDFPPDERKPLRAMLRLMDEGKYDPLLAVEDGEPMGYALLWLPESRTVEFVANGAGYRFQVYGREGQEEAVELLVSRFVRLAVTEGLNLSLSLEEDPASSALATGEQGNSPAYDPGAPQN